MAVNKPVAPQTEEDRRKKPEQQETSQENSPQINNFWETLIKTILSMITGKSLDDDKEKNPETQPPVNAPPPPAQSRSSQAQNQEQTRKDMVAADLNKDGKLSTKEIEAMVARNPERYGEMFKAAQQIFSRMTPEQHAAVAASVNDISLSSGLPNLANTETNRGL